MNDARFLQGIHVEYWLGASVIDLHQVDAFTVPKKLREIHQVNG